MNFERNLSDETETTLSVASTMLVMMVKGSVNKLNFPYAQLPVLPSIAIC